MEQSPLCYTVGLVGVFILNTTVCICQLPWWLSGKKLACQCRRCGFDPCIKKILWRRKWQPAPVFCENPRDTGAWWDAVQGVTMSRTQL